MTEDERPGGWASMEELYAENQRLKAKLRPNGASTKLYVVSTVVLCVLVALFVLAITLVRPVADNMPLILAVLGVVTPIVIALLAKIQQQADMRVREVGLAVDGRLSQLLELTAEAERAKGELSGMLKPTPGVESAARAEGKAAGVEQERARTEKESV